MTGRIERWHQVSELFDRVADLEAGERKRILDAQCADDPELRAEVERLLRADGLTNPLDHDIAAQASLLLLEGDPEQYQGEVFGPYRIERLLGQGGMGRVYLARREGEDFTQTVALKLVGGFGSFEAGLARHRFLDERRILARLEHPHIARLLDGGVGPQAQPWFAMEYVDGAPLTTWCDERKLDLHARLELFAKVCDAVDHAHQFLIVHRDLKPGNVLVDARGEPKVLDFGIAKLLDEGAQPAAGSTIVMTPDYAAPEQMRGGQISTATDVYSLGAMLFELLTGRKPFVDPLAPRQPPTASRSLTGGAGQTEHATACGTTPRSLRRALRGDMDRIIRTALDPDPARRYRSAGKLAEDLRAVVAGEPISLRSDRTYRVGIFMRKHRLGVTAAAAAVVAVSVFVWRLSAERERAQLEAETAEKVSDFLVDTFNAADPRMRGPKGTEEPTARRVLDLAVAKVDAELAGSPAMLARMHAVLGRAYSNLGEREHSEAMLRQAADAFLSKQVSRPDLAAEAYAVLSTLMSNQMRVDDALHAAQRSLELNLRYNPGARALGASYQAIGLAKKSQSDFAGARAAYAEALVLNREAHGPQSLEVAYVLHDTAGLLRTMGDFKGAEKHFRQALDIKLRHGSKTVTVQNSRQGLAGVLSAMGRFDEAISLQRESVRLAEELFGRDSERVADGEMKLAMVLQQAGDYAGAGEHYRDALDITERVLGRDSIDYAVVAGQLAWLEEARGDFVAAEALHREATQIRRAKLKPGERTRARNEAYWGWILMRMGRTDEARLLLDGALPVWLGFFKPTDTAPEYVTARLMQSEWLLQQGRLDEAEAALPEVGEDVPAAVRRRVVLAKLAQRRGDTSQALLQWRTAIDLSSAYVGPDSAPTAQWRVPYAQALHAAGQADAAAAQLRSAEAPLRRSLVAGADLLRQLDQLKAKLPGMDARTNVSARINAPFRNGAGVSAGDSANLEGK